MKKLVLSVDELRVESFSTSPAMQGRHGGTVRAREHSHGGECLTRPVDEYTVHGCTFDQTQCNATCAGDTCPYGTEWGAYSCNELSCAGACVSDNCETFDPCSADFCSEFCSEFCSAIC
jgi:hypothetical protein